jgi:hypothetical protein
MKIVLTAAVLVVLCTAQSVARDSGVSARALKGEWQVDSFVYELARSQFVLTKGSSDCRI